jgi:hypothetical protein
MSCVSLNCEFKCVKPSLINNKNSLIMICVCFFQPENACQTATAHYLQTVPLRHSQLIQELCSPQAISSRRHRNYMHNPLTTLGM